MKSIQKNKIRFLTNTFFLATTALLLAGCDTLAINPAIKEEHTNKVEKIAIVNLLSDTFNGIHIGTTVFNNKYYEEEIADWKIREVMNDKTKSFIEASTSYQAQPIELSEEQRLALLEKGNHHRPKMQSVFELCKAQGFDTVIIYRGVRYENEPFHRSPYGYFSRKVFKFTDKSVYSLFILDMYDVATEKNIAWHWGYPNGPEPYGVEWKENYSEFTEAETLILKQTLINQVTASIATALGKILKNTQSDQPRMGN